MLIIIIILLITNLGCLITLMMSKKSKKKNYACIGDLLFIKIYNKNVVGCTTF